MQQDKKMALVNGKNSDNRQEFSEPLVRRIATSSENQQRGPRLLRRGSVAFLRAVASPPECDGAAPYPFMNMKMRDLRRLSSRTLLRNARRLEKHARKLENRAFKIRCIVIARL